jgi:hypothetical protein
MTCLDHDSCNQLQGRERTRWECLNSRFGASRKMTLEEVVKASNDQLQPCSPQLCKDAGQSEVVRLVPTIWEFKFKVYVYFDR